MFGLKRFLQLSAVAAVSVMMIACAGDDKSAPAKGNMIPDNAVIAVKVSADQLFNKALGDENSPIRDYSNMAKSGLSGQLHGYGELGDVARQTIKDPAKLGVNMEEPFVVSCSYDIRNISYEDPTADVFMVALLDDRDAFAGVVDAAMNYANEELGLNVTKEELNGSYTYYEFLSEAEITVGLGVAENAAVLRMKYEPSERNVDLKGTMLTLFANGGPKKTEGLKEFYATASDVAVWMDVDATMTSVMPLLEDEDPYAAAQIKPYLSMCKGASVVTDLDFKNGQTVVNYSSFGSKDLMANAKKFNKPASDKFLKLMPATTAVALNVAIKDFPGLIDYMCQSNEEFQQMLDSLVEEFAFDKKLLEGFPGTISFALDGNDIDDRDVPGFMVCLESDKKVWKYAETYLSAVADSQGDDTYIIDEEVYFLYEDGHITIADAETMLSAPMTGTHSFADTELGAAIKKGGMAVNFAALPGDELVKFVRRELDLRLTRKQILDCCSSVVLTTSEDFMSATLTLNMNDKEHNLLEKIILTALPTL
jgi:hypothetical protein